MQRKAPDFWRRKDWRACALQPLSVGTLLGARLRQRMVHPQEAGVPVLCIGNLTAGGAGKTPLALYLGASLQAQGRRVYFLSRGYGGKLKGPLVVNTHLHTAEDVGDEPLLLAACAPTVVARDRVQGACFAREQGAEVIVMDDGFQDPAVVKDCSILVVDAAYGFGNGLLLPAGPLREPVEDGLKRADAVLMMDGDMELPVSLPVFHGTLEPHSCSELKGKRVVGFAGIGRPEKFRRTLESLGCDIAAFHAFADHQHFSDAQWSALREEARTLDAQLVTTEKDAARLSSAQRTEVFIVKITLRLREQQALDAVIRERLADAG